jgi:hypothetical protein
MRVARVFRRMTCLAVTRTCAAAFVCGLLLPAVAGAANPIEIAPFMGQRMGGSFEDANTGATFELTDSSNYGLMLDFDINHQQQYEVYVSRQDTRLTTSGTFTGDPLFDLTIDYYHIGGVYMIEGETVRPFVSGSLGLTRMDPKGSDLNTENHFSLALGTGIKFYFTQNFGLRFDARIIYTALSSDTAIFCSGGCAVMVNSSGFTQTELGGALMLRF